MLNMKKVIFFEKDNDKTYNTSRRSLWSEYYTCKGCEKEVNCKGHLTKPQEAVHVEINKNNL